MPPSEMTRAAASESARVTTAAESRYRITAPNSLPRTVAIVALDPRSDGIVAELAPLPWGNARFFGSQEAGSAGFADAIADADLLVLIALPGTDMRAPTTIGPACQTLRVTTTAVVVAGPDVAQPALAATLAQLRPHSGMLVTTSSAGYIADMLTALRA
jgi:hypothetical protein